METYIETAAAWTFCLAEPERSRPEHSTAQLTSTYTYSRAGACSAVRCATKTRIKQRVLKTSKIKAQKKGKCACSSRAREGGKF